MDSNRSEARVVRMIWAALLMSVVIYGVMVFVIAPPASEVRLETAFNDPMVLALHIAGIGAFVMSFVASSIIGRRSRRHGFIIRWALMEAAAVFGLLAAVLRSDARLFLPLGALAFLGILLTYPSTERFMPVGGAAASLVMIVVSLSVTAHFRPSPHGRRVAEVLRDASAEGVITPPRQRASPAERPR